MRSSRKLFRGTITSLYWVARIARSTRRIDLPRGSRGPRRVVHVSPLYFGDRSYVGGGERYATSLAASMAERVDTTLVTFGPVRDSFRRGRLRVEVYPAIVRPDATVTPLVPYSFLRQVLRADVVHCHQYKSLTAALAAMASAALCKRVFLTDEGGGGGYWLAQKLPLSDVVDTLLPISTFSAEPLPRFRRVQTIYGGVDGRFLAGEIMPARDREGQALFVGRLLPHKGINYLIEAIDGDTRLDIIGRAYSELYFALLQALATHKQVHFNTHASDDDIISAYRTSLVTVLPSVYVDVNGFRQLAPELLGLVLLESMACGTPIICTAVGGMPEFVEEGVTGFVVPPNDPAALRERIGYLISNPRVAVDMGRNGRRKVLEEFTWDKVVERCLAAYRT